MRKAEAAQGALWNTLSTVVNKLFLPFVGIYFAGKLGTSQMGLAYVVSSLYAILELFRDGGLALTFLSEKTIDGLTGTYQTLTTATGALMGLVLALGSEAIARAQGSMELGPALVICGISMIFGGFGTVAVNTLVRQARFRDLGIYDTVSNITGYVVAAILIGKGMGFMALVWQILVRVLVYTFLCVRVTPRVVFAFSKEQARRIGKTSFHNMGSNVAYTLYTMGDYQLMTRLFGPRANGLYGTAYNLANKPTDLVAGPINRTLFVLLSRREVKDYGDAIGRTLGLVLGVTLPMFAILGCLAPSVIGLLYPPDFGDAALMLQILSLYLFARALGGVCATAFPNAGKPHLNAIPWILAYLTVGGVCVARWGQMTPMTLVYALTAGALLVYGSYLVMSFHLFKMSSPVKVRLLKILGAGTLAVLIGLGIQRLPAEWFTLGMSPEWLMSRNGWDLDKATRIAFKLSHLVKIVCAMGIIGTVQAVLCGIIFLGRPLGLFSLRGIKRAIHEV